jgi:hypothetical protein
MLKRMNAKTLARSCAVLLPACATLSCGGAASNDLVLRSPSRLFSASVKVTPDGNGPLADIEGPSTSAALFGDELRGRIDGSPLILTVDDHAMRIKGLLGQQPVNLRVRETEGGYHVSGLFAGSLSDYDVTWSDRDGLRGVVGKCSYDLRWAEPDAAFEGMGACTGGNIEPVFVQQPAPMRPARDAGPGLSPTQTVALLTIALAR